MWLPLGLGVAADLEASLRDCPEAAVTAIIHSLSALDKAEGDAGSLQLVKMLHHLLPSASAAGNDFSSGMPAPVWQQKWLNTIASLVRFTYGKWIQVPQDDPPKMSSLASSAFPPAMPALRRHHAFLFQRSVDKFLSSGVYDLKMTEHSVLFSEAFAFFAFCQLHDIGVVLESGVYKGVSTEILSLFADEVVGIDAFVTDEAKERLRIRPNVRLLGGDGRVLLPQLLEEHSGRRVAVFIDGPKGELAIRLAMTLQRLPQVAFVAIHDMTPYRSELTRLGGFFFSDESWFQTLYGHLDAPFHARPDISAGGTMAFLPGQD